MHKKAGLGFLQTWETISVELVRSISAIRIGQPYGKASSQVTGKLEGIPTGRSPPFYFPAFSLWLVTFSSTSDTVAFIRITV